MNLQKIDQSIITLCQKISVPLARLSLFVVYFWFGILKVVGLSPASGLVHRLFDQTIPYISFDHFIIAFGLLECVIGVLFLIKGVERIAGVLFFLHMITTTLPLLLLSGETWSGLFTPTLEAQYIIKNVVLVSAAVTILGNVRPKQNTLE